MDDGNFSGVPYPGSQSNPFWTYLIVQLIAATFFSDTLGHAAVLCGMVKPIEFNVELN